MSTKLTIAVVDDQETIRLSLGRLFSNAGHQTHCVATGAEAIEVAEREAPDVFLVDLVLPDIDGIEVLRHVRRMCSDAAVIIISAHGDVERTVEAMKEGAENFISKPIDVRKLEALVETVGKYVRANREIQYYRGLHSGMGMFVGVSEHAQQVHQLIGLMAENSATTVLLFGESGTGKGLVASLIHAQSERRNRPFVEVCCAEFGGPLLESELFGHEKGAFTDAKELKKGLAEVAKGGTLFLDEIGELRTSLQPKLLKFVERKTFRRVGGVRDISADVRIMAATNADLEAKVRQGSFREDLFFRLNVMPLRLRPLREHPEDIALLVDHFIARGNHSLRGRVRGITEDALAHLRTYAWPGNVRELGNVIERAMILAKSEILTTAELPGEILQTTNENPQEGLPTLEEMERELVAKALQVCNGNRSRAAKSLGISRSTLHDKMLRFDLG